MSASGPRARQRPEMVPLQQNSIARASPLAIINNSYPPEQQQFIYPNTSRLPDDILMHHQNNLSVTQSQQLLPHQFQLRQLDQHQRECLIQQQLSQDLPSSSANCSFDDLADFNPKDINFSDVQLLWTIKDPLNVVFRVALVAPIILLGILGNLTIIYSMCKFKPFRSKPTNIFILNMAIADLLTTLVCPSAALFSYIYQFYVLGSFICRVEGFVKITCFLVSSYSLIVLSSDWLLCVVQPCRKRITIEQSWLALLTIWITSVIMASPLFFWRKLRHRQWKDLVEIWCCELIQYTKYYWVVINFFLIYLPTFFMTIVLVIILAQMDKFEAKLRRSRTTQSNSSLTINMNYRRRIVKILFTYLLTSIICWTPLQVFIIYRHFRTQSKAAAWFFELNFFTSLSASLTAATNPIIFGFLSQPFRKVVRKTLMFKFFDKIMTTNSAAAAKNNSHNRQQEIFVINNNNQNNHHKSNHKSSPKANHPSTTTKLAVAAPAATQEDRKLKLRRQVGRKQSLVKSVTSKRAGNSSSRINTTTTEQPQQHHQHHQQPTTTDNTNTNNYSKRVSFLTNKQQQQVRPVGRDNHGYVHDSSKPAPSTSGQPVDINTTSFMETGRSFDLERFRVMSAVSMDSINIEENLADGRSPDSLQAEKLDQEEDGEQENQV